MNNKAINMLKIIVTIPFLLAFTALILGIFYPNPYIYYKANTYIKENYSNVPDIAYYNISKRDSFIKNITFKKLSEDGRVIKEAISGAKTRTREYYLENDSIKLVDCNSFGSSPVYYISNRDLLHNIPNVSYFSFNKIFCESISQEEFKLVKNNKESIDTFMTYKTSMIDSVAKVEEQIEELKDEIKNFKRKSLKEVALVDGEDYSDIIEAKKEKLEELKTKPEIKTFEEFLNDKK